MGQFSVTTLAAAGSILSGNQHATDLARPPDLLAVGSSVAWMHLDGSAFEGPDNRFLNGGTAHLRMNQIRAMTRFYLDLYMGVSKVLMVTAIPDFRDCANSSDWVMDRTDAAHYVSATRPAAMYYLQYFAPGRYLRQVISRDETLQPYAISSYWHDPWGTTPIHDEEIRPGYDLRYGEMTLDPMCFEALELLSRDLSDRGVEFHIVLSPVNPRYADLYPSSTADAALIVNTAHMIGLPVLDLHDDQRFASLDFWDAFHLQWPAAQRFSSIVADELSMLQSRPAKEARHVAIQNDGRDLK